MRCSSFNPAPEDIPRQQQLVGNPASQTPPDPAGAGPVTTNEKSPHPDEHVDRVAKGLADLGGALVVQNGANMAARYANAIALVRGHGYSITRAAREVGISATHLTRKLNAIGTNGDLQARTTAEDRRILEMSQALSILAGDALLDRIEREGDQLKTSELAKIYTSSPNQVATKQRWSQGATASLAASGMSALVLMLEKRDISITKRDATKKAVDVTPESSE